MLNHAKRPFSPRVACGESPSQKGGKNEIIARASCANISGVQVNVQFCDSVLCVMDGG